jgi:hypothetical protein
MPVFLLLVFYNHFNTPMPVLGHPTYKIAKKISSFKIFVANLLYTRGSQPVVHIPPLMVLGKWVDGLQKQLGEQIMPKIFVCFCSFGTVEVA